MEIVDACIFADFFDRGEFTFADDYIEHVRMNCSESIPPTTDINERTVDREFRVFTSSTPSITQVQVEEVNTKYQTATIKTILENPQRYLVIAHTTADNSRIQSIYINALESDATVDSITSGVFGNMYSSSNDAILGPYSLNIIDLMTTLDLLKEGEKVGVLIGVHGGGSSSSGSPSTGPANVSTSEKVRLKDFNEAKEIAECLYNPDIYPSEAIQQRALLFLIAHHIQDEIQQFRRRTTSTTDNSGLTELTQRRVGLVSEYYITKNFKESEIDSNLNTTLYGQKYAELTEPFLIGGMFVSRGW